MILELSVRGRGGRPRVFYPVFKPAACRAEIRRANDTNRVFIYNLSVVFPYALWSSPERGKMKSLVIAVVSVVLGLVVGCGITWYEFSGVQEIFALGNGSGPPPDAAKGPAPKAKVE